MSFNLGFPTGEMGMTQDETHDDDIIQKWLQELDKSFSLVIIVEYFDESLILLRRLMCWSWKEIMYYSRNVLRYNWKDNNDPENIRIYKERNRVDYILYDHFNQTFWKKVKLEPDDFWEEVSSYKKELKAVHKFCDGAADDLVYSLSANQWTSGFTIDRQECYDMVHYFKIFLKLKERYDDWYGDVVQPPMTKNVC